MTAIRYQNQSTSQNVHALIEIIENPATTSVVLFASPKEPDASYTQTEDGPDTNMPLVSALVTFMLPGFDPIQLVYDGIFLTAARRPRFLEVVELMDAAQASTKVQFSSQRLQFTAGLDPVDAANVMAAAQALVPFSATTRAQYFALLSTLTEANYSLLV